MVAELEAGQARLARLKAMAAKPMPIVPDASSELAILRAKLESVEGRSCARQASQETSHRMRRVFSRFAHREPSWSPSTKELCSYVQRRRFCVGRHDGEDVRESHPDTLWTRRAQTRTSLNMTTPSTPRNTKQT